jgi:hypothetical protein
MNMNDKPQRKIVGRPFEKGDARINRAGAPGFAQFRKQALEIANEKIPGPDSSLVTRGEALLRSWLKSHEPKLQELFAFYAWGKPADRLELEKLEPKTQINLVLSYAHEEPVGHDELPLNLARDAQRRLKG